MHLVKREMNRFIHTIHFEQIIIYDYSGVYEVLDNDVCILVYLLDFNYILKNDRKVIFIDKNYLSYVLTKLREFDVSYVVLCGICKYDKLLEYVSSDNNYKNYYLKGKRILKRRNKINKLMIRLRKKDISLLREVLNKLDDKYKKI